MKTTIACFIQCVIFPALRIEYHLNPDLNLTPDLDCDRVTVYPVMRKITWTTEFAWRGFFDSSLWLGSQIISIFVVVDNGKQTLQPFVPLNSEFIFCLYLYCFPY